MTARNHLLPLALVLPAALLLTSCSPNSLGGNGTDGSVGFDGVQSATIQIEAVGTFVDPSEGGYEAAGRGSGFIIDESGLAVTNNHVVVGAGTLKVWRGGDTGDDAQREGARFVRVPRPRGHRPARGGLPVPRLARRRHRDGDRRVRGGLPARRPQLHHDARHRLEGIGAGGDPLGLARSGDRARRPHPRRQLGRPARRLRRARSSASTTPGTTSTT